MEFLYVLSSVHYKQTLSYIRNAPFSVNSLNLVSKFTEFAK